MSEMIGRLRVALGLETAAFEKGARRAGAEVEALGSRAEKAGYKIGSTAKAIYTTAAAFASGQIISTLRSVVDESIRYAESIGQLSKLANASTEEFQRAAYAAKSVGIESEKLADIYKDVNDKVGEFLQTGGGELKDFFDVIGPKVGVTAEQFRNLSGPQALQLYVSSLQKAGVNQQEMTFYMEAIADEASALAPILRDGGQSFNQLGDEAEKAGLVLANGDISRVGETAAKLRELNSALQVRLANFVVENSAVIISLANALDTVARAAMNAVNAYRRFKLQQGLGLAENTANGFLSSPAQKADARRKADQFRYEIAKIDGKVDTKGSFRDYSITGVPELRNTNTAFVPANFKADSKKTGGGSSRSGGGVSAAKKAADEFDRKLNDLQDRLYPEVEALRKYREELDLIAKAFERGKITADQAAEARKRLAFEGYTANSIVGEIMADDKPKVDVDAIGEGLDNLYDRMRGFRDKSGALTVQVAKSFGDMATDTVAALDRMASAVQGGGVLNILSAVLQMGLQLGSIGAFGSKIATNINTPRRAWGGPVNAGQMYMVGERGPEMFVAGNNGHIVPNHRLSGGSGGTVVNQFRGNLLTPEWWAQINAGHAVAAQAGGEIGYRKVVSKGRRRLA